MSNILTCNSDPNFRQIAENIDYEIGGVGLIGSFLSWSVTSGWAQTSGKCRISSPWICKSRYYRGLQKSIHLKPRENGWYGTLSRPGASAIHVLLQSKSPSNSVKTGQEFWQRSANPRWRTNFWRKKKQSDLRSSGLRSKLNLLNYLSQ